MDPNELEYDQQKLRELSTQREFSSLEACHQWAENYISEYYKFTASLQRKYGKTDPEVIEAAHDEIANLLSLKKNLDENLSLFH